MALSMNEIAEIAGVSYATVRRHKLRLGRTPTIEEMIERKGKVGRPTLAQETKMVVDFLNSERSIKMYVNALIKIYGEETTLKEINERIN